MKQSEIWEILGNAHLMINVEQQARVLPFKKWDIGIKLAAALKQGGFKIVRIPRKKTGDQKYLDRVSKALKAPRGTADQFGAVSDGHGGWYEGGDYFPAPCPKCGSRGTDCGC